MTYLRFPNPMTWSLTVKAARVAPARNTSAAPAYTAAGTTTHHTTGS